MTTNKCFLVLVALFLMMQMPSQAQYHLRNGDMSDWVDASKNSAHARYWNSMKNGAEGSVSSMAPQVVWQSTDVPLGQGYIYSTQMKSKETKVLFISIVANGQMTTGAVHAASSTADSPDKNYNYTRSGSDYSEYNSPIVGTPDSIRFWAKCVNNSLTDSARVSAVIHDEYDYHDPEGTKGSAGHAIGKASLHFTRTGESGTWIQYTAPFIYDETSSLSPAYILVTFTTNKIPGGGKGGDELYVTGVELVYNSWLADLKMAGVTVDGFETDILDYAGPKLTGEPPYAFPYNPEDFTCTPMVKDATVEIVNVLGPNGDAEDGYTSIVVTAEDKTATHGYKVHYYSNRSSDNNLLSLGYTLSALDTIQVPEFSSSTLNYNVTLTDPEEVRVPQINQIELSDAKATILRVEQPTSVNSKASVVISAENDQLKTYTVNFSKVVSSNSTLSEIKIGNEILPDFNAEVLEYDYDVISCATSMPIITATTSSAWATFNVTQPTFDSTMAIIVVTAEDGSQTTYNVNLTLKNNNTTITGYKIASSTRSNVFSSGNFVHTYAYRYTAAPSLTVLSTQQSCKASIVTISSPIVFYPDTNYITVTAQDGITTQIYKSVIKNTNCYLKETTGDDVGLKYKYNGAIYNIAIDKSSDTDVQNVDVTLPIGPNVPAELIEANPQAPSVDAIIYTQPESRNSVGSVKIVANDEVANKTYTVTFIPTLSTDATLSNITYNGESIVGFTPNIENYTVMLPSENPVLPEFTAIPSFQYLSGENIVITPAASLFDTTKITVTAEDGITTKNYFIAFDVADAYVQEIKYNDIVVEGFNPNNYSYTVDLPYTTTELPRITAKANVTSLIVHCENPVALPGEGKVYLLSDDSTTVLKMYTIDFRLVKNTDATLVALQVNGKPVQDFSSQKFVYEIELPYTEHTTPVVLPFPAYEFSKVDITPIDTVVGEVKIVVTAEDETYTNTYTILFTRELSPVTAIDTIKYERNGQIYTYEVTEEDTEIEVMIPAETEGIYAISEIVLEDYRSDYQIIEQPTEANDFIAKIIVTAEDLTENTYYVSFKETLSGSTLLSDVRYEGIAIPDFNPSVKTYNVILPWDASVIPAVTAVPDWKNTTVQITQPTQVFGQAQILVVSENGQNNLNYTINFQRQGEVNIVFLSYDLDTVNYPIADFDPLVHEYHITLPIGTKTIPVLNYELIDSRTQVESIPLTAPDGEAKLTLTTWNQDTTLTYTVQFVLERSTNPNLSGIYLDGEIIEGFNPNLQHYSHHFEFGTIDHLPVITATAAAIDAHVEIQQPTSFNDTTYITCYAGDTNYVKHYKVLLTIDSGNNAHASAILIDEVSLESFDRDIYDYYITLPDDYESIPYVEATPEASNATYTVIDPTAIPGEAQIEITAKNGIDKLVYRVHFSKATAINSLKNSIKVAVYPIPCSDYLNIQISGIQQVSNLEIYAADGKITARHALQEGENAINVDRLSPGIYYYKLFIGKETLSSGKFIKK